LRRRKLAPTLAVRTYACFSLGANFSVGANFALKNWPQGLVLKAKTEKLWPAELSKSDLKEQRQG
jgi:hypothetical protein